MGEAISLGKRLLLARRDLKIDQKELGQLAGVSNGYISDIERGRITNVGVEIIFALADTLGVSRAYLLGLVDDPLAQVLDSPLESDEEEMDALTRQIVDVFQQLTDDNKMLLLELARKLRSSDAPKIIGE